MKHAVITLFLAFGLVFVRAQVSAGTGSGGTGHSGTSKEPLRLETTVDAMGSTYGMVLYGEDQAQLRAAADEAAEEVRRLDRLLSNYVPASEWSEVNRFAATRPVKVSVELFDLLSA